MKTVYHAGPNHRSPLCGTRGSGNRYGVVVLQPAEWNALNPERRCFKCVAKIQSLKKS